MLFVLASKEEKLLDSFVGVASHNMQSLSDVNELWIRGAILMCSVISQLLKRRAVVLLWDCSSGGGHKLLFRETGKFFYGTESGSSRVDISCQVFGGR